MTQHQPVTTRCWVAEIPFQDLVVGTADPGHDHLDQELKRTRLGVGHLIESERLGIPRDHGDGLHESEARSRAGPPLPSARRL